MIKKILILCLVFSPLAFSQELSEAYLESLPESVKEDVLKGMEEREEKVGRGACQRICTLHEEAVIVGPP